MSSPIYKFIQFFYQTYPILRNHPPGRPVLPLPPFRRRRAPGGLELPGHRSGAGAGPGAAGGAAAAGGGAGELGSQEGQEESARPGGCRDAGLLGCWGWELWKQDYWVIWLQNVAKLPVLFWVFS